MASRELNILVAAKGALKAARDIGQVDSKVKGLTGAVGRAGKVLGVGAVAAAGAGILLLQRNVDAGIASLKELEQVENATNAVIQSTGGKAGVTAAQVRKLAEEQENLTTVDDKVVQAGENMLLTFTGIGADVFPMATKAMVNMAVAMNNGSAEGVDLKSTAIQIGKALNDPIKGVTALRKAGVALTEQQQKDIKSLVKQGKMREAQLVILKELEVEFGKAGEAAGKGAAATQRRFDDAVEGAQQALATGLLPVIEEVQKEITGLLSDTGNLEAIKGFGQGLAGAFREGIKFAKQIPWSSIADAMKLAGTGAKAALDMFTSMPPWVQTAVVTGWGLNKLTGGAVSGLVGQLGSGLIKGVLGMNAGVVNINAGVVNGGGFGGKGGIPPLAGAAGGGLAVTGGMAALGIGAAVAASAHGVADLTSRTTLEQRRNAQDPRAEEWRRNHPLQVQIAKSGSLSPEERQSRNNLAKIAYEQQRQGERGGRMQTALERAQIANERYANSTAPSIKSMDANMAQLRSLQQQALGSDTALLARIEAAINRLAGIQSRPTQITINNSANDVIRVQNQRRRAVKPHGPRNTLSGAMEF